MTVRKRKRSPQGGRKPPRAATERARAEQIQVATYRISEAAHSSPTLDDLYREIHRIVGELMPAKNFYIALYDAATDTVTFPYFVDEYDQPHPPQRAGRGLTEYVLRTGEPLLADEALHDLLTSRGAAAMVGTPSLQWLGVPLTIGDRTIGVLAVQTYTAGVHYGQAEERVLAFVSRQIAMAIERKRVEVALRASELRLARAQEAAHLGSWELDLTNLEDVNQNPIWWSDEVYRIFGYAPGEVPASNELFFKSVPPEDVPRIQAALQGSLRDGIPYCVQHRVIRPDGTERIVEERSTIVRDPAGRPIRMVGTVLDVTDHQRLEEQLRQAQKMEAVGRLAGGVAHDFNNLLTAILGSAELLLGRLGPDHPERVEAEEIRKAALWAADLTRQLLAFSRQQVLDPQVFDLSAVVADMDKMLRRLVRADITFRTRLASDLGAVRADPGQIEQVIMNLAVNACDAMPGGGTLTIETANVELGAGRERDQLTANPGRYVMLTVSDTGTGMSATTQAHIFEPFFTTKERGKGTGLGLSTVYGIVKQSEGYVWLESEPGRGTTFKVYLPRVDAPIETPAPGLAPVAARGGAETILVVEDQEPVRRLTCKILETQGYAVLVAADGPEALQMAERHQGVIDILVTDVVMPGMSGREVGRRLAAVRPGMRVLYLSGYADDSIVSHGVLAPGLAFLQKPFTPETLARRVRELLDAPPGLWV
jgi:two-component system cell cycle sensor histidine kinase/response regulator CckA